MNKELLLKVKERILKEPARFDMDHIFVGYLLSIPTGKAYQEVCFTTACIAGWTLVMAGANKLRNVTYSKQAAKLLRISYDHAFDLFYEDMWPENFQDRNIPVHIRAAAMIDDFIKTSGGL